MGDVVKNRWNKMMSDPAWNPAGANTTLQCQQDEQLPNDQSADMEVALGSGKPQQWLNALSTTARQNHCRYVGYEQTSIASELRQYQWSLGKKADTSPDAAELKHLVRLADNILFYFDQCVLGETWDEQRNQKVDDFAFRQSLHSVETLLYADGRITPNERVVLNSMLLMSNNVEQTDLYLLAAGYSANRDLGPVKFPFNKHVLTLFRNKGNRAVDPQHPDTCQNYVHYKALSASHPEVAKRQADRVCYDFALSDSPSWSRKGKEPLDIVRAEYVPVPLDKKGAKVGDLVVYFDFSGSRKLPQLYSPHMAVVSQVDRRGRPTHIIAKFGEEWIYEHPINEAPSWYGHFFGIFRRK